MNQGKTVLPMPAVQLMPVLTSDAGVKVPIVSLLQIDPANIIEEFRIHAAWQASISWGTAQAEIEVARRERELEVLEARLMLSYRTSLKESGGKVPGVEMIKSSVIQDNAYELAFQRLMSAKEKLGAWKAACSAMFARKECLINMGAETRLDRKGSQIAD